ncbi:hypothetical protein ABBQ32_002883 [Trebouxia sp. C0010 RCD-2024]
MMSMGGLATSCLLLVACVYAQSSPEDPQLLLSGRFGGDADEGTGLGSLPLVFSWPASSVRVTFEGSSINATLAALPPLNTTYGRFAFYLDNTTTVEAISPNDTTLNWGRSGLSTGPHNLTIQMLSEARYGEASLDTLTVGPGGRFLMPALPASFLSGRRIMFLGDSYTVGWGNVGGNTTCGVAPVCATARCPPQVESENAAISWGPIVAANLQADYQVLAWSGAGLDTYAVLQPDGINRTYITGVPDELPENILPAVPILFRRQVAGDNTSMAGNSSFVPQIVVMAGGTNDFHGDLPPLEQWISDNLNFMSEITDEYGENMQIILQVFPLEVQVQGVLTVNQTTQYLQYMSSLYTAAQQEGQFNVHFLQLNGVDMPLDNWCVAHPSSAADRNIAQQLLTYINRLLPNYATSTFPRAVRV